jgi:hypothetical protein
MEYVAGEDARRIEKRAAAAQKGIPIGVIVRIIADAAAGLDFAHKAKDSKGQPLNLVHRDVSPQNILVGFDGSVKLIDFGVAKAAGRAQHTATGILKGKFPYMSPEQARGDELDPRSDVFALGIVLWEMLTGRRLFKGENDLATQKMVLACQVPVPSDVEPSVPKGLDPIVMKALAKDAVDRFPDAAAFRMALEEFALKSAIPSSSAHLSSFMHELYAERIQRESNPKSFEEDSGLTDLDVGGLAKQGGAATVLDRNKLASGSGSTGGATRAEGVGQTQAVAPPARGGKGALWGALGAVALLGIGGAAWWSMREKPQPTPTVTPGTVVTPTTVVTPPPVEPKPVELRVETDPAGADVELAGQKVGQTPYSTSVLPAKLPMVVRVTRDGYEAQQGTVTADTPVWTVQLKKKAGRPPVVKNPNIKTTR